MKWAAKNVMALEVGLQGSQNSASWLPHVRYTHPNYFTVLVGETLVHAGLFGAAFYGAHATPSWFYFNELHLASISMVSVFGVLHGLIAVTMVLGMYWRWSLTRMALLFSVTVYLAATSLFAAAVVRGYATPDVPVVPVEGIIYNLGLIMLSTAAYKEPMVPGQYHAKDKP